MQGLLIVDEDMDCRKQMASMFIEFGYNVIVTNSVESALSGILKKTAQVVLLGTKFDELTAAELIPLLKQCNRKLTIIALKPGNAEDREEIRQAVQCAFESVRMQPA